jgi:DNA-binding response OmpR family regulator
MPSRSAAARILVVEDDPTIALGLGMLLEQWGYALAGVATTGERALVLAADGAPDLVLMDVGLDGRMDGIETAAALRFQHTMPILFLTAQSDPTTSERLAACDADGVLVKPVAPTRLRRVMDRLLAARAARVTPVTVDRAEPSLL